MRAAILSIIIVLSLSVPGLAETQDSGLKPAIKPAFKERHPKVYKVFRKTRHVCILIAPIVNVAANCATAAGVFLR